MWSRTWLVALPMVLFAASAGAEDIAPIPSATPSAAVVPSGSTLRSEIYVPAGIVLYSSQSRLLAGVGGGLGYRYDLDSIWSVYAEGRTAFYTGNLGTVGVGVTGQFNYRFWNPQIGMGAMLFIGDGIRVSSSTDSVIPAPVAFAITTRISPLRFVRGRFAASALSVDVGCGMDSGSRCGLALSVSLLEGGLRF